MFVRIVPAALLVVAAPLLAQRGDRADADREDLPPGLAVPEAPARSPGDERATFRVQDGYSLELCAAEPMVGDPVAATFDAAGRLWVVEMRGYMPDLEGRGEREPTGVIAVLVDRDGDGAMDERVPFLEHLVLPRAVLPLQGGALVIEPPRLLWAVDVDGDLRADRTEKVLDGFESGLDNPEHCGNGLLWALDNGIHLADDARFLRWQPQGAPPFAKELGAGGGQWGIAQDDRGRLFFDYNEDWLRCDLVPGRYGARGGEVQPLPGHNHRVVRDPRVFPIRVTPGVNRGGNDGILKDGVLQRHTAACAPFVYRGTALPCGGDVFVCEPAANVVRRFRLADHDALLTGANVYDAAEFVASTDERFRPVNLCQGPDGALYVVDMYRGLIQHKNFVTTFLQKQVRARGLERPIGLGRVWRVVPPGGVRTAARTLAGLDAAMLVQRLQDGDGWQRDQAQRLLVQQQATSAVPALRAMLRSDVAPVARLHAMAVLDGLGSLAADDVRRALHEVDAGVLAFALGAVAPLLQRGDSIAWAHCERLAATAVASVRWHLALALGDVDDNQTARATALLAELGLGGAADTILRGAIVASARGREAALLRVLLSRRPDASDTTLVVDLARAAAGRREAAVTEELFDVAAGAMAIDAQAALLRGALAALPTDAARQRGFFVFAATPPALLAMARTGNPTTGPLVQRVLAATELRADTSTGDATAGDAELDAASQARVAAGARVFGAFCAACHQPHGRGQPGLAPPLRDSEWVTGPPERLVRIALHGVRGPITAAGVAFDGEMPGQRHLGDDDLAAALSYLRRAFGHRGSVIAPEAVRAVREAHAERTAPWTPDELNGR